MFLCGYASDMNGTKALHLEEWARANGRAFLRFDYSGCGASEGNFEDETLARLSRAKVERVISACEKLNSTELGKLMALLRRFEAEAARAIAAAPGAHDDPRLPQRAEQSRAGTRPVEDRLHEAVIELAIDAGMLVDEDPLRIGQTGEEPWTVLSDPEGNEFCILQHH